MAKLSYKIPADLDAGYLDMEIAVQKDGIGIRPLPIRVILFYIGSFLACFCIIMKSFVAYGSFVQILFFVITWVIMTLVFGKFDRTKQMQVQLIPTLLNYIPKAARHVITRTHHKANGFYSVAGIRSVDKETGTIHWEDGTYGQFYRVVGSASILLFDEDRDAILDRVDMYYRKMHTDYECGFLTMKESQKVYAQIANLKRRYDALDVRDPDLLFIANEQFDILKNFVGDTFKSIHQYMFLKSDNKESLTVARNMLQSEVENSTLMFKQCNSLDYDDTNRLLRDVYAGLYTFQFKKNGGEK